MTQSDQEFLNQKNNIFVVQEHLNIIAVVYPRTIIPGACERSVQEETGVFMVQSTTRLWSLTWKIL